MVSRGRETGQPPPGELAAHVPSNLPIIWSEAIPAWAGSPECCGDSPKTLPWHGVYIIEVGFAGLMTPSRHNYKHYIVLKPLPLSAAHIGFWRGDTFSVRPSVYDSFSFCRLPESGGKKLVAVLNFIL